MHGGRNPEIDTGVLDVPPPDAWIAGPGGDSSISLYVFGWLDQRRHSFPKVRGEAIRLVLERFADAGIEMPVPIHQVRLSSPTPPAVDVDAAIPGAARRTAATPLDLSRDSYLDREIAEERAQMTEEDLLDPRAAKE
jgi:small conductance mechanosensitive channel